MKMIRVALLAGVLLVAGCGKDKTTQPDGGNGSGTSRYLLIGHRYDIVLKDLRYGSETYLTSDSSDVEDGNAQFSYNGNRIIWYRFPRPVGNEVWIMNRDGGNKAKIADGVLDPVNAVSDNNLVVLRARDVNSHALDSIIVADFSGNVINEFHIGSWIDHVQWTLGGDRILYDLSAGGLYIMNSDGSGQHLLTNTNLGDFGFMASPNSNMIALCPSEGGNHLELFNLIDSTQTVLVPSDMWGETGQAIDLVINWSGDSQRIFFTRDSDTTLCHVGISGGASQALAQHARGPCVSNDGTRIAYSVRFPAADSLPSGDCQIVVANVNGANPTVVFSALPFYFAHWIGVHDFY